MTPKKIVLLIVAVFALSALISVGIWGFKVATAPIKGQGDASITKYSAENWTAAQARFEDMYSDIEATDRKIEVAQATLDADPTDKTAKQTLSGDSAKDDGTYGNGDPGIFFFFTTDGIMVETDLNYIQTDAPLSIDVPRLGGKEEVKK